MKKATPSTDEATNRLNQLGQSIEDAKTAPVPTSNITQQQQKTFLKPAPITPVKGEEYYTKLFGVKPVAVKGKHLGFKIQLGIALHKQKHFDVFEKVKEYQNKYNETLIESLSTLLELGLEKNEQIEKKQNKK